MKSLELALRSASRRMLYVDSSAVAKVLLPEPESAALRTYLDGRGQPGSSVLVEVEVRRAVRRVRPDLRGEADRILAQVVLIQLDDAIVTRAATIVPPQVRSFDAIHIASALLLGEELEAVVTYDERMSEALERRGCG